jgi:hypothetical protein
MAKSYNKKPLRRHHLLFLPLPDIAKADLEGAPVDLYIGVSRKLDARRRKNCA